ncbi:MULTISPECIES: acetyl-CoA carboxylase biotin carboxyl carrier protein [Commensalibacter]|uniref:Biotin carboxyl carrier protein of acetyl-CoA carboxylase n=1 Tax=Commensalibacter melissae TaxID=2070537 RepID=A0A318N1P9_9PROT|nr:MULTISPECIES: acetyl-CoA carboxylase biotin carboxyl carrier protein [Commensalibacter]MCT6842133.1 acetyl-CoA carboxylase biotin carboxyl carrier protein [Commensalibacter sp.]AYN86042.1 acetyl-CoA carboxylase biotin carboxyl carrier protein [Commensalibacter melissae]MBH9973677.1 acetyl-CoA carboxylase biotin carboxyl carrier protein [Commensalibacter melissae]MBI0066390.1 acetyl-CoA carboxylase biotin carboxyl carrier protein [Commensalibacter sp. M0134]MBI0070273.1 acetyl-CoA carboxylas
MSKMLVDVEVIRKLADILTETGLTEIEVSEKDQHIRVVKNITVNASPVTAPVSMAPVMNSAPVPVTVNNDDAKQEEDLSKHPGALLSPMIGVAYLTPEPSAPPFVTVGQEVQSGQIIMLIEAMKTFNQIRAHKSGKLTRMLVNSGDPVEYGEVLAVIE